MTTEQTNRRFDLGEAWNGTTNFLCMNAHRVVLASAITALGFLAVHINNDMSTEQAKQAEQDKTCSTLQQEYNEKVATGLLAPLERQQTPAEKTAASLDGEAPVPESDFIEIIPKGKPYTCQIKQQVNII